MKATTRNQAVTVFPAIFHTLSPLMTQSHQERPKKRVGNAVQT